MGENLRLVSPVRRLWAFAVVLALLSPGLVTELAAKKAQINYDKTTDFSKFKTYAWVPGTPAPDPRVDKYITDSVTDVFRRSGMTEAKPGEADIVATYHVAGSSDFSVGTALDPTYASSGGVLIPGTSVWAPSGAGSTVVRKGTITFVIVNRAANKAVWTGSAQAKLADNLGERWGQVQKALDQLFHDFPPVAGKS